MRSYIRIGALAAFILFALASVVRWGFRWYGLVLLLSIWAVLGAWTLMSRKAERNDYKTRSIVRRLFPPGGYSAGKATLDETPRTFEGSSSLPERSKL